jgi:hypothetical protein
MVAADTNGSPACPANVEVKSGMVSQTGHRRFKEERRF